MKHSQSSRRSFVKFSALGMGGMILSPIGARVKETTGQGIRPDTTENKLNILCIGAHPGDPEFGCGGTLAEYSQAGHQVSLFYLTRGEAGDPSKTYSQSAALRTREAEVACQVLKARAIFAGQIDANTELTKGSIEELAKRILLEKPDIVFTHWPLDTHPDHQIGGLLAFNAWVKAHRQFHLYFYEVNTGSETLGFEPTDYVDITKVREIKKEAMFAHKTQDPEAIYRDFFKTMEEFRGLEAGVKAAEGFIHFRDGTHRAGIVGL